jgi:hypothetical protein
VPRRHTGGRTYTGARMNNEYAVWLFFLGAALGSGLTWLLVARLPRRADDLDASERTAAAAWIAETIEAHGGAAPVDLVEQVLDLNAQYLAGSPVPMERSPSLDAAARLGLQGPAPLPAAAEAGAGALAPAPGDPGGRWGRRRGGTTVLPSSMEEPGAADAGQDATTGSRHRPSIRASGARARASRAEGSTRIDDLTSTPAPAVAEDAGDVEERPVDAFRETRDPRGDEPPDARRDVGRPRRTAVRDEGDAGS